MEKAIQISEKIFKVRRPLRYNSELIGKVWTEHCVTVRLRLKEPNFIDFKAGQYVSIIVDDARNVRRPYSIASSPLSPSEVELCIDTTPRGLGSVFFENILKGGEVNFIGPLGFFTLPSKNTIGETDEFYFLATGCGITPLKSQILYLLGSGYGNKIKLYFGCKTEKLILYKELFEKLHEEYPNFEYCVTLSQPSDIWGGKTGWVTKWFDQDVKDAKNKHIFICGNPSMMKDTINLAKSKGFKDSQIHYEKFI